jgi:hypothetical protein
MKAKHLPDLVEDARQHPAKYGLCECCLCGREQLFVIGVWIPDSPEILKRLKTPPGKHRTVIYALCEECCDKGEEAMNLMEKEALKAAAAGELEGRVVS